VNDLGISGHGVQQQRSMAMRRLPLHAQQRTRLFANELEHLRRLHHRLGKLELTRVDARHIRVPARPRCRPSFGGRAERLEVHVFDPSFFERAPKRGLRKARAPRQRQRTHVDHALDARLLQRGEELGDRGAFISDGEDAHLNRHPGLEPGPAFLCPS
jgi:hypothetical protein